MQVPLAPVDEIPTDGVKKADFFGREVLLTRQGGRPRAVMNVCLHLGGPLEQEGDRLVCAWHAAAYDLSDGRKLDGPGRPDARLLVLPTRVIDGVLHYVYGPAEGTA
jgi:nitrite reductase/ring-hydroxylating ferredoxin subunit